MSNIKRVFKTAKGTEIPLLNLKGKEYLQVAHRLIILDETHESYSVNTELIQVSDVSAVSKATVTVWDKDGRILRSASSTKRETKSDFPDFIEKAETGSIGRALALIGIGTQFCTQDMEEGSRLADSPVFAKDEVKAVVAETIKNGTVSVNSGGSKVESIVSTPPPFKRSAPRTASKGLSDGI